MFARYQSYFAQLTAKIKQLAATFHLHAKPTQKVIGLDISSGSIKLLCLNIATTPFQIENYEITPLSVNLIQKDEIKDIVAVSEQLKEMVNRLKITTQAVAIAIPRSIAILKTVVMDNRLAEDEIETRAWIEANRHFPDLVGEIYLDFFINGPSKTDPSLNEVTLVACRKDQIRPLLEILHHADLQAKVVDVDAYALERALRLVNPPTTQAPTIALLNLNTTMSSLIVIQNDALIYAHDQGYDGQRLISQTSSYLKAQNERLPPEDLKQDLKYKEILHDQLVSHLRHTMHFFYTSKPDVVINHLILAGDCANIAGLCQFIQEEVGIETKISDLSQFTQSEFLSGREMKKDEPALMLACGLALSQMEHTA